jgi:hypothetical protein
MVSLLLVNALVVIAPCVCSTHPVPQRVPERHACCAASSAARATMRGACCCDGHERLPDARPFTPPPPTPDLGPAVAPTCLSVPAPAAHPVALVPPADQRPPELLLPGAGLYLRGPPSSRASV